MVKRHKISRAAAALTKTTNAYADADVSGDEDSDDVFIPSTTSSPKSPATGSVSPNVRITGPSTPRTVTEATVTASDKKAKEDEKAMRDEKYQRDKNTGYFPRSVASQYSGVKEYKSKPMPVGFMKALRTPSASKPHRKTASPKPATPEDFTARNVTPNNIAPEPVTPESVTSKDVSPDLVLPKTVTPKTVFPKTVTPKTNPSYLNPTTSTRATKQEPTMPENNLPLFAALLHATGSTLGILKSAEDITHAKLTHIAQHTAEAANDDATGVRLTDYRELLENISAFAAGEAEWLRGTIAEAEMKLVQALGPEFGEKFRSVVRGEYVDRREVLGRLGLWDDWEGVVRGTRGPWAERRVL